VFHVVKVSFETGGHFLRLAGNLSLAGMRTLLARQSPESSAKRALMEQGCPIKKKTLRDRTALVRTPEQT
jgi:hypothetical protein